MTSVVDRFLDECAHDHAEVWRRVSLLPILDPVVQQLLSIGINAAISRRRHRDRTLVKQGRADEITSPSRRTDAENFVVSAYALDDKHFAHLAGALNDIMKKYEDSIFAKFIVAGKPLAYATPEVLTDEADAEERSAKGHTKNAVFYRRVAKLGTPHQPIGTTVPVAQVEAAFNRVFRDRDDAKQIRFA
jgi:hypothetical protein